MWMSRFVLSFIITISLSLLALLNGGRGTGISLVNESN